MNAHTRHPGSMARRPGRWAARLTVAALLAACGTPPAPRPAADGGRLVEVNGTRLFVKRVGAGTPVLVVHGGPVLEHGYLAPHLAGLAQDHELIFFDQRLSGRSDPDVPAATVRLATFVQDIEALRVALGLERIHLLAHSWGGLLAMQYAIRHGDRLRSLVLLDSVGASSDQWLRENAALAEKVTEEHVAQAKAIRESEAFARREPAAIAKALLHAFRLQFHDPARIGGLQVFVPPDYMQRSDRFAAMMVDLQKFDFRQELRSLRVPTLLLYGGSEPSARIAGADLRAQIPGAKFVEIPDAGHFPFVEQPEQFTRAVGGFLAAVDGGR